VSKTLSCLFISFYKKKFKTITLFFGRLMRTSP